MILFSLLMLHLTTSTNLFLTLSKDVNKSSIKSISLSDISKDKKSIFPNHLLLKMSLKNNNNVTFYLFQDLKTNKISSLSLLDKIEEEVEAKFIGLDKLSKSLIEFE